MFPLPESQLEPGQGFLPGLSVPPAAAPSSLPPAQAWALSGGAAEPPVAPAPASHHGEGAALRGAALSPSPAPLHLRG